MILLATILRVPVSAGVISTHGGKEFPGRPVDELARGVPINPDEGL
jgi:hypothetical protein